MPVLSKASVSQSHIVDAVEKSLDNSKVLKEKKIDSKENIMANRNNVRERSTSRTGKKDIRGKNDEIPLDRSSSLKDKKEILEMKDKMEVMTKERDF